ncbi:hypothetical protein B0H14DRAFT_2594569 [Mycena olivaceomarginata]|nr:hypothetical protein B0H14DRAFT_2594569 [Mycena olivaceomarginata]
MKYVQTARIQKIIKFWSGIVFHGVDTGSVINKQTAHNMNDREEANFVLVMERMVVDTVDTDEEEESLNFEMGHHALWELDPPLDPVGPAQQEPPASPVILMQQQQSTLFKVEVQAGARAEVWAEVWAEARANLEAEARAKEREEAAIVVGMGR